MRFHPSPRAFAATGLLGAAALAAASCSLVLGIGDPSLDPAGGSGGKGGSGGAPATASVTSSASASTSGAGGEGGTTYPCTPTDPTCSVVKSDCLAVHDNTGKSTFAVRVGQLDFFKPDAFNGTLPKAAFLASITMNLPKCNLKGSGSFSWIVQVDTAANTFKLGASKPAADPHDGYSFVNETVTIDGQMFPIAPVGGTATLDADGTIHSDVIESITLPVYLDAQATNIILVPLHKVRVLETTISPDRNCIGSYNAQGLKPADGCLPNTAQNISSFINGGKIDGFVSLEEADKIILQSFGLNRSLCVLLSNSAGVFGDGGSPARCKRDGLGKIKFNGDWCGQTNTGADGVCYDSMQFYGGFAASAVELK